MKQTLVNLTSAKLQSWAWSVKKVVLWLQMNSKKV